MWGEEDDSPDDADGTLALARAESGATRAR